MPGQLRLHARGRPGCAVDCRSRPFDDADQLGDRVHVHLLHAPGAVHLDRLLGGAEIGRDLLVQAPGHDVRQHLALARRQRREQRLGRRALLAGPPEQQVLGERLLDRREQHRVVDRLGQEVEGAELHRLGAHRHVGAAGQENDRQVAAALGERLLQRQPVEAGQRDIENEAAVLLRVAGVEKRLGRGMRGRLEPCGAEQAHDRGTNRCVVVDHMNVRRRPIGRRRHAGQVSRLHLPLSSFGLVRLKVLDPRARQCRLRSRCLPVTSRSHSRPIVMSGRGPMRWCPIA